MNFLPVALWTDVLIWLLVAAFTLFAAYCARRPHLAAPWARVFRSRAAVASAVVLAAYLAVGLLDSRHYRPALPSKDPSVPTAYAVEVRSALDAAFGALRERTERSYSAPLATRLYQKETFERPDGRTERDYPRLRFGGKHLADEADWAGDVTWRVLAGARRKFGDRHANFLAKHTDAFPLAVKLTPVQSNHGAFRGGPPTEAKSKPLSKPATGALAEAIVAQYLREHGRLTSGTSRPSWRTFGPTFRAPTCRARAAKATRRSTCSTTSG